MAYELALADAHSWLETLEDGSVDLVCCDTPFNTTALLYDQQPLDWPRIWRELYRVCKPASQMVFFTAQPFTTQLINSNPKDFRLERIWVKSRGTGHLNARWRPLQQHEDILVFCREPMIATYNPQMGTGSHKSVTRNSSSEHYGKHDVVTRYYGTTRQPTTVMPYSGASRGRHPSEKPLELLRELVLTYSREGDLVVDFCSGSGTTAHACLLTNRNFKGCELDPVYHATAKRRLEAVQVQTSLFTPDPTPAAT